MAALNRVRVAWSNWPGAPGVSTFYLDSGTTNLAPLKTFFDVVRTLTPNALTTDVPNTGDVIDTGTGHITGNWTGSGGGTSVSGVTASGYSGASGALIRWNTGAILNGRRLIGRTYLVPLAGLTQATDGSLQTTTQASLVAAGQALITAYAGALRVYGPPRDAGTLSPSDPGKAAIDGAVTSCQVPDIAAVMRSRRV